MMELGKLSTREFSDYLRECGVRRFFLAWDEAERRVVTSHPALQPLADLFSADRRDFDRHEGLFVQYAPRSSTLQSVAIHRTSRGQGAGGTRYWGYDSTEEFLRDGLRLSRGMTLKNALAGIWWGGGKGVIAREGDAASEDHEHRRRVYEEYGEFITSLRGAYVTAEDVGTTVEDMAVIFTKTRFTTCIPEQVGGSGNPSAPTALGVVRGMEAALRFREMGTLAGKQVIVQGLGHVGLPMIAYLLDRGVQRIIGSDIDGHRVAVANERFAGRNVDLRRAAPDDTSVLAEEADVLAPCAVGGVLTPETIPRIKARIVCGAANNLLLDPRRDGEIIFREGITFLPDFLVNRMGIVTCANEQYGYADPDPAIERHLGESWSNSIYRLCLAVLERARDEKRATSDVALEMAVERSEETHPIWGDRSRRILQSLIHGDWAG